MVMEQKHGEGVGAKQMLLFVELHPCPKALPGPAGMGMQMVQELLHGHGEGAGGCTWVSKKQVTLVDHQTCVRGVQESQGESSALDQMWLGAFEHVAGSHGRQR